MDYFMLLEEGKSDSVLKNMESLLSELGLPCDWAIYGRYIKFYSLGDLNQAQLDRLCSLEDVVFFEPEKQMTKEFHKKSGLMHCNGVCNPFRYGHKPLKESFSEQPKPIKIGDGPIGF